MTQKIKTTQVPDPLESGATLEVKKNITTDPLEHLFYRKQINQAQKQAGDRFKKAWETIYGATGQGIDLTRPCVDSPIKPPSEGEKIAQARKDIDDAIQELGKLDSSLMNSIAGEGRSIAEISDNLGYTTEREKEYIGKRFRDALDILAQLWGYAASSHLYIDNRQYNP